MTHITRIFTNIRDSDGDLDAAVGAEKSDETAQVTAGIQTGYI
jgi:hypothetical protein